LSSYGHDSVEPLPYNDDDGGRVGRERDASEAQALDLTGHFARQVLYASLLANRSADVVMASVHTSLAWLVAGSASSGDAATRLSDAELFGGVLGEAKNKLVAAWDAWTSEAPQ
jgi:hypothetical protein